LVSAALLAAGIVVPLGGLISAGATALSCTPPEAPATATATAGVNQASASWTAPTSNGTAVTGYVVRVASVSETGLSVSTPATATAATIGSLAGNVAVTLSVQAESACGDGPPTATTSVTPTGAATTFAATVLADQPDGYYRLTDQTGSTTMADSSGNSADGTYSGQQTLGTTGALPGDPDTATSYTTCCSGVGSAGPTLPLYNSARTVEAFIKTTNGQGNQGIAYFGNPNATDEGFEVSISPSSINVNGGSDFHAIVTPRLLDDGSWHQIDVTYDGTTVTAYLDGQPVGTTLLNGTLNTTTGSFNIAGGPSENIFTGSLEEVSVYPTALSAARIAAHFAASGYSAPAAPHVVHAAQGAPNVAQVSWGAATSLNSPLTGYLVTVTSGPNTGQSVATSGAATAADLGGLAPGKSTFQVQALNAYGFGPPVVSASLTVAGAKSAYAATVLADGPYMYYRLGDTTTSLMADSSGNGLNGDYVASNVALGQPGALLKDPSTSVADLGTSNGYGYTQASVPVYSGPRSYEFWLKSSTYETDRWIYTSGQPGTDNAFNLEEVSPGELDVSAYNDDRYFSLPYPIDDGNWHQIDVTYDGTTVSVYLDGVAVGSGNFNSSLNTLPGSLYIGNYFGGGSGLYDISLQDFAIYTGALLPGSVAAHFKASGYSRPTAPKAPAATPGGNQATVTWTAATSPGVPLLGYLVTAVSGSTKENAVSVGPTTTSAVIGGLPAGNFTFTVQGFNAYGLGSTATTTAAAVTGATSTYASTVLADQPSMYYRLGDTATSLLADSSGHGANGIYVASNVTQGAGGAIPADPTTSVTDQGKSTGYGYSSSSVPLYNSARTYEFWLKTTTNESDRWIYTSGETTTQGAFDLQEISPSVLDVDAYNDAQYFFLPYPIDNGVWHQIDVAYDGTSIVVYLDGVQVGTGRFNGTINTLPGGLDIGSYFNGGSGLYGTDLQDFSVYPVALSAGRVAAHFTASGYSRPTPPGSPTATGGSNQASVTWTASGSSYTPVTGYLVTALSGTAVRGEVAVAGTATTAVIGGLAAGSYTFKVQGLDAYGLGSGATTAATTVTGAANTYESTVLSDKPSLDYRLGDTTPLVMADSSGNRQNGEYIASNVTQGGAGAIPGDPTTSVADQGQSNGYGFTFASVPSYNSARTYEFWLKSSTNESGRWLFSSGAQTTDGAFDLAEISPYTLDVDGYNDVHYFNLPYPIDNGVWHQIAVTYDGKTIDVYLDGVSVGTSHFSGTLDSLPGGLDIGSYFGGGSGLYSTDLQDFAVYPTALTSARVAAHFAASGYGRPVAPGSPGATGGVNQATVTWAPVVSTANPTTGYLVTAVSGTTLENSVAVGPTQTTATIGGLAAGSYTFNVHAVDAYGVGAAATTPAATVTGAGSTYASTVLSDQPSVYYRLGDSTTAVMADSSGHHVGAYIASNVTQGGPGAILGDPTTSVADQGQSTGYGYSNDKIPAYNSARSFDLWVKSSTSEGGRYLYSSGVEGTDQAFDLIENTPSVLQVDGWNDNHYFSLPYPIDDGVWHQIVVTYDGYNIDVYLDGVSVGTSHFNGTLDTIPNGVYIGNNFNQGNGVYATDFQEFSVYPTALSSTQVAAQFAASGNSRPAAPSSPAVIAGANQATVSWTAPPAPSAPIKGYLVTAISGTTQENAVSAGPSAGSVVVGGLPAGSYTFKIQAFNSYGLGPAATTAAGTVTGSATTYESTVLSNHPLEYYELGDSSGSLMADSSGAQLEGLYVSPDITSGHTGPIASDPTTAIGGNGNWIGTVLGANLPLYNQARTVETWIQTTDAGEQYVAGWGIQSTNEAFDVSFNNADVYVRGYNDDLTFTTTTSLSNGSWHFLAVTVSGTAVTVYVDGVSVGTQDFSAPLDTLSSGELVVGGYTSQCCGISGNLAQLAVFGTALSATNISSQFSASTLIPRARRTLATAVKTA
jgi:hypothetical protein